MVQVVYNIFNQAPEDTLFPTYGRLGVAVIARVPFDEGSLTGTLRAGARWPDGDWRNTHYAGEPYRDAAPGRTVARARGSKGIVAVSTRTTFHPRACGRDHHHSRNATAGSRGGEPAMQRPGSAGRGNHPRASPAPVGPGSRRAALRPWHGPREALASNRRRPFEQLHPFFVVRVAHCVRARLVLPREAVVAKLVSVRRTKHLRVGPG